MSEFMKVDLMDVDLTKFTYNRVDPTKTSALPDLKYAGKTLIISGKTNNPRDRYFMTSFKGLKKGHVWDQSNLKYTTEFSGDYEILFHVCNKYKDASPAALKLLSIIDHIRSLVIAFFTNRATGKLSVIVEKPYLCDYTKIKDPVTGQEDDTEDIDPEKSVAIKFKIGYQGITGAKMMKDQTGQDVPIIADRVPKAKFYNVNEAKDKMLVPNPDPACSVAMKAIPEFILGTYRISGSIHITRRLLSCYYEPAQLGASGPDMDLIADLQSMRLAAHTSSDPLPTKKSDIYSVIVPPAASTSAQPPSLMLSMCLTSKICL